MAVTIRNLAESHRGLTYFFTSDGSTTSTGAQHVTHYKRSGVTETGTALATDITAGTPLTVTSATIDTSLNVSVVTSTAATSGHTVRVDWLLDKFSARG